METDYLLIGAGALGMGFIDTLIEHSDAEIVIIDRRHGPGGHWLDSYPFVQLHQPSMNYGVNSTPLGRVGSSSMGETQGFTSERADQKSAATTTRSCVTDSWHRVGCGSSRCATTSEIGDFGPA